MLWGGLHLPANIEPLVKQLSSAKIIQRNAVANHAGELVGVAHTTQDGVGVFLVNVNTQEEIAVQQIKCSQYRAATLSLLGWSPDDRYFAYTMNEKLILCNGTNGAEFANFDLTSPLESFAWLSVEQGAYLDSANHINFIERDNGRWRITNRTNLPQENGKLRRLVALDTNVVAWHSDNSICKLDIATGKVVPVIVEKSDRIMGIAFSRSTKTFLVTKATANRTPNFILGQVELAADGVASEFIEWDRLERGQSINNAQWFNGGKGYLYRLQRGDDSFLVVKREKGSPQETLFAGGKVWDVFANGESPMAYAIALKTNEPAGFWQVRADTKEMGYAFSPWGKKQVSFPYQPALVGYVARDDEGRTARIEVVPPVNYSRHKKYPLVISFSDYEWSPLPHAVYAQALAHSGVIVALVPYNNSGRLKTHTNAVLNAYDQLTATRTVDTDRVYLAGFSAGTDVIKQLVEQFPGRWRGVMLMSPTSFPEPKAGVVQQVLLTAGSVDGQDRRFPAYQEELCRVGIPATWYIHENEHHSIRGQSAFYDRTMLMLDMIFER
jgi:dipeptidyl aminopeptidase/acylaminoacyl peptidase